MLGPLGELCKNHPCQAHPQSFQYYWLEGRPGYQLVLKRNKALKLELPSDIVLNENAERNKLVSQTQVGDKQYTGQVKLELANGTLYIQ